MFINQLLNLNFAWLMFAVVLQTTCFAQVTEETANRYREDFDSPKTSFKIHRPDCANFEVVDHFRSSKTRHTGEGSEYFRYRLSHGTHFYVEHPITKTVLLRDFSPSLWVKSTRSGIQLLARVVMPHTPDPLRKGKPITALLYGPSYEQVGSWQQLTFKSLQKDAYELLAEQTILLNRKYGVRVDTRDAYVDSIFLNLYTSAGETNTWIDDLKIEGAVPQSTLAQASLIGTQSIQLQNGRNPVRLVSAQSAISQRPSVKLRGGKITIDEKPFFPRLIEHQGESFQSLKALGFNAILMPGVPNQKELDEAQRVGLWLIAPPPPAYAIQENPAKYDRVLAWFLGNNLKARDIETSRQIATQTRRADVHSRPIVAGVNFEIKAYSQFSDIIYVKHNPIGSSFPIYRVSEWIQNKRKMAGPNTAIWSAIQTEYSHRLLEQIASLDGSVTNLPIEHFTLKKLVWNSLAALPAGIVFQSRTPLQQTSPQEKFRSDSIQWINWQIDNIEPWLASGTIESTIKSNLDRVEATVIKTERSKLVLLVCNTMFLGDSSRVTAKISGIQCPSNTVAFEVAESGVKACKNQHSQLGLQIELESPNDTCFVVTNDATTLDYFKQATADLGGKAFERHHQLSGLYLVLINRKLGELSRLEVNTKDSLSQVQQVVSHLEETARAYQKGNMTIANQALANCDNALLSLCYSLESEIQKPFTSRTASPLIVSLMTLPAHYRLTARMQESKWSKNLLPAGDFENLERMKETGWDQVQVADESIQTKILLSETSPKTGKNALHLRAWRADPNDKMPVETTPVWVASAPVQVRPGQMVRLHGWIKINSPIAGSTDGMMVIDSIGGASLAERFTSKSEWQEFSLYRSVTDSRPFRATFALTGLGEAIVDDVSVMVIDLPSRDSQPRNLKLSELIEEPLEESQSLKK